MRTGQVFVSHTCDMAGFPPGRSFVRAALDAVSRAGLAPVDMRYFAARDGKPADYCRARVRECEIYVAVVGFRYGSLVPGEAVSYTELEFNEASAAGLPRLVFLLDDVAGLPGVPADADRGVVEGFRQRLRDAGLVVRGFGSASGLELEVFHALTEARSVSGCRGDLPDPAVRAGLSADERRAAALDAAGVPVGVRCPYPGLAAFQPEDAERFCGRGQLTALLVARAGELLARPGLLMVVGPSGSGKSSLLRAGLLPAVAAGALPRRGSGAWPREVMTPGRRPLLELAVRIGSLAGVPAGALEADLRADPARVTGAIRQALLASARKQGSAPGLTAAAGRVVTDLDAGQYPADEPDARSLPGARSAAAGPRLVLVVDQFEEVFTHCADERERRAFIQALCAAAGATAPGIPADGGPVAGRADAGEAPALVVVGIRADFYARSAACPELASHLQDHQVLVGPIDEAGLREAIEKPAALAGLVADAALVEVLLADLGLRAHPDAGQAVATEGARSRAAAAGQDSYPAGRLALLSYALQQTWRNRESRRLTVAGYRTAGGIDGAVAQAADHVYTRLDPAAQDTLRRVLLRLVALGEGTPDSRRRVTLAELTGSADSTRAAATRAVLADLIDARLVTASQDTIEITHEMLLAAWPRLRRWLTDDRAGLRIHRDLTDAALGWQQQGRDPGRLFRGTRLALARDWAEQHDPDLNDGERAFLTASQHHERRAARLRRGAAAALAALTVLSAAAAGLALQQRATALTARDQAIASQVITEAGQLTATDPSLAAQLDLAASQISPTPDSQAQLVAAAATPLASLLTGPVGFIDSVAFSPDRKILAAGGQDSKVWLWNLTGPAGPARLGPPLTVRGDPVYSVTFSPDGKILAVGTAFGKIWLWNLTNPARPARLGPPLTGLGLANLGSVAFSLDGKILAAGGFSGQVWLWNLTNPARPARLGPPLAGPGGRISSVAFSPDGQTLAAGSDDHKVWLWNLTNPARPTRLGPPLAGPGGSISSVAFSLDGKILAAGGFSGQVWLWNLTNPARPARLGPPLAGPGGRISSVAFSPDGQTLAAGSDDHKVWLWNLTNPARPTRLGPPLAGPGGSISSVAFSPDGQTLAAGSDDHKVWLWNLQSNVLTSPAGGGDSVAFSPHTPILAAGSPDGKVQLWNLTDPARRARLGPPLTGTTHFIRSVAFSPDGRILAAGSLDGKVQLWNLTDPARPARLGPSLTKPYGETDSVAFSPDGTILAAGSGNEVSLWSFARPARPALEPPLTRPAGSISPVAFSPNGKILATGSFDGTILLWNLTDPARPASLGPPLTGPAGGFDSMAFSPRTPTLAASSADGAISLWNLTDPARATPLGPPLTGPAGGIEPVAFSPNGKILATGSFDGTILLWNLTDPARPASLGPPLTGPGDPIYSVAFSPDGTILAAGTYDGTILQWNLDVDAAIRRICATTSNTLTPAQWKQYIPQLPFNPPCTHPGHNGLLLH